jgi:cytoskeletal protein RodZ
MLKLDTEIHWSSPFLFISLCLLISSAWTIYFTFGTNQITYAQQLASCDRTIVSLVECTSPPSLSPTSPPSSDSTSPSSDTSSDSTSSSSNSGSSDNNEEDNTDDKGDSNNNNNNANDDSSKDHDIESEIPSNAVPFP